MTPEQRVLNEAERWFRSKLRGETPVEDFERRLFSALAKRQNEAPEVYVPRDLSALDETAPSSPTATQTNAIPTKPPPPDVQHELVRLSRARAGAEGD